MGSCLVTKRPTAAQSFDLVYRSFNLLEETARRVLAWRTVDQHRAHHCYSAELWYVAAFTAFALTDFREAWEQALWLICLQLINQIALFVLRRQVMQTCCPNGEV